jgi:hypothetical protein
MKEVRIDLFKLQDENDKGQGIIKAINNPKLKFFLKKVIKKIREKEGLTIKDIAKRMGFSYLDFYNKLFRKQSELGLIQKLIELWGEIMKSSREEIDRKYAEIQDTIEELTYGAGNTRKVAKAPKFLTKNLCKIAGSVIADGHLITYVKKSGYPSYVITVVDESKDNLLQFCDWIKEEFGVEIRPKYNEKNNYWRVDFGNKIIYRYLNKLFEIPAGEKYTIVKVPNLIKFSNLPMRISFLNGLFLFDGGVGSKTIYFNYSTKSTVLLKEVKEILAELNISPDYVSDDIVPSTRVAELRIWSKEKLKNFVRIFGEVESYEKWIKLKSILNQKTNNFQKVNEQIKKEVKNCPKKR